MPAFGRDSSTGRRLGKAGSRKALRWPKGKVHPDGRLLEKLEGGRGRERRRKDDPRHILIQESKEVLQE